MTLIYKQQSLIVSLNFTKIINLLFKSDWLITMLLQGKQRNMLTQEDVALGKIRFCISAAGFISSLNPLHIRAGRVFAVYFSAGGHRQGRSLDDSVKKMHKV